MLNSRCGPCKLDQLITCSLRVTSGTETVCKLIPPRGRYYVCGSVALNNDDDDDDVNVLSELCCRF